MRPASLTVQPQVHTIALGKALALFDEREQQLFQLNESAQAFWARLTRAGDADLPGGGAGPGSAAEAALLGDWLARLWLVPAAVLAAAARPARVRRTVRTGAFRLTLGFGAAGAPPGFEGAFSRLTRAEPQRTPDLQVVEHEGRTYMVERGQVVAAGRAEEATPLLKALVTERYARSLGRRFLIHAAVVETKASLMLLVGPPGAGKSTLAAALAVGGARLLGDDLAEVDARGRIRPAAFGLTLKSGSWPLLASLDLAVDDAPALRRTDGQAVRYLPWTRPSSNRWRRFTHVVTLERGDAGAAGLESLDAAAGLQLLLAEAWSAERRIRPVALIGLAAAVGSAEVCRLTYARLDDAVDVLGRAAA